jgi:hypothetical protein
MARPETEIRHIVQNMQKMGWEARPTTNGTGFIVSRPGHAPVTINTRAAGRGRGWDNVMREIRKTGYETAWADYQDRQRDQRIADAPVAASTPEPSPAPEPPSPASVFGDKPMTSTATANGTPAPVNRDLVDGVKVTDRTPAKLATPMTNGEAREFAGVDEIMLEDGRVLYQCVRSAFCAKTFETPLSARAHLTAHGTVRRAAKEDRARRLADDSRAAKSMASQIGHEVRRARVALLIGDESRAEWLNELAAQLEAAVPMLRELARHKVEVPTLVSEEELAELRAKAAKWDTFLDMTRS